MPYVPSAPVITKILLVPLADLFAWSITQVAELTDKIQDALETWISDRQQMLFKLK